MPVTGDKPADCGLKGFLISNPQSAIHNDELACVRAEKRGGGSAVGGDFEKTGAAPESE